MIKRHTLKALAPTLLLAMLLLCTGVANGQSPETRLIVSYIEAPMDGVAALDRSVQAYAEQMRHGPGAPVVEILRETERPNRLVVLERWQGAVTEPDVGATALQQAIAGKIQAPLDRRLGRTVGPLLTDDAKAPFHVVAHVDVVPDGSAQGAAALQDQRAMVMAAPGALGFEFAVQSDKPNHFAVHEIWASAAAYRSYIAGPGGWDLRWRMAEFRGSPFDDRFYVAEVKK